MVAEKRILFLLLTISVSQVFSQFYNADNVEDQCPIEARVNLTGEDVDSSGFIVKWGYAFPPESIWLKAGDTFGCVCYTRSTCAPLYCPKGSAMYRMDEEDCDKSENSSSHFWRDLAAIPLLYSLELPIKNVLLNVEDIQMEGNKTVCMWTAKSGIVDNDTMTTEDDLYFTRGGSIFKSQSNITELYNFDSYCLCRATNFTTYDPPCLRSSIIHTTINRHEINGNSTTDGVTVVVHIGTIVSIPFLIVTFIVYAILPEMKNIHGLTLRGYVGCLLVAYTTLAVVQTTGPISDIACHIFAFTLYFSFLASFFWLNVICFDIWWTFSGLRSLPGSAEQRDRKKFILYSIYAWSCAILLTGICAMMNFVRGIPEDLIRPEFGIDSNCWFNTKEAKAFYFYGPMSVTILSNIFFFASTAVKIIKHKRNTRNCLKGSDSKRHNDNKQWFNLYLKLFIVMGINWAMEVFAWLFDNLDYLWYITDTANALQGLIIFVIFICKKNIKQLLIKRYGFTSRTNRGSDLNTGTTTISQSP